MYRSEVGGAVGEREGGGRAVAVGGVFGCFVVVGMGVAAAAGPQGRGLIDDWTHVSVCLYACMCIGDGPGRSRRLQPTAPFLTNRANPSPSTDPHQRHQSPPPLIIPRIMIPTQMLAYAKAAALKLQQDLDRVELLQVRAYMRLCLF